MGLSHSDISFRFRNTSIHSRAYVHAVLMVPYGAVITTYSRPAVITPNGFMTHAAGKFANSNAGRTWI